MSHFHRCPTDSETIHFCDSMERVEPQHDSFRSILKWCTNRRFNANEETIQNDVLLSCIFRNVLISTALVRCGNWERPSSSSGPAILSSRMKKNNEEKRTNTGPSSIDPLMSPNSLKLNKSTLYANGRNLLIVLMFFIHRISSLFGLSSILDKYRRLTESAKLAAISIYLSS